MRICYTVPESYGPADRFANHDIGAGIGFMVTTWDPPILGEVATEDFQGWEYHPDPDNVEVHKKVVEGLAGLMKYRLDLGYINDKGEWVGPTLLGYDMIAVPATKAFVVPESDGEQFNWGTVFKSTFRLPKGAPGIPKNMPPVHLLMREEVQVGPDGKASARMYLPFDEFGRPIGPATDRPDDNQHELVGRQIQTFATTGKRLKIPPVRQVFRTQFPDVRI
jgi:hypothetical protein